MILLAFGMAGEMIYSVAGLLGLTGDASATWQPLTITLLCVHITRIAQAFITSKYLFISYFIHVYQIGYFAILPNLHCRKIVGKYMKMNACAMIKLPILFPVHIFALIILTYYNAIKIPLAEKYFYYQKLMAFFLKLLDAQIATLKCV